MAQVLQPPTSTLPYATPASEDYIRGFDVSRNRDVKFRVSDLATVLYPADAAASQLNYILYGGF